MGSGAKGLQQQLEAQINDKRSKLYQGKFTSRLLREGESELTVEQQEGGQEAVAGVPADVSGTEALESLWH